MKYKIWGQVFSNSKNAYEEVVIEEGDIDIEKDKSFDNIPTAGSMVIEIAPGRWLSINQSEWCTVYIKDHYQFEYEG